MSELRNKGQEENMFDEQEMMDFSVYPKRVELNNGKEAWRGEPP